MAKLTITIDDDLLRKARIRALEQGTSVNAVLRQYLTAYVGAEDARRALSEFVSIAESATSGSGEGGRSWRREDLYDR